MQLPLEHLHVNVWMFRSLVVLLAVNEIVFNDKHGFFITYDSVDIELEAK